MPESNLWLAIAVCALCVLLFHWAKFHWSATLLFALLTCSLLFFEFQFLGF